MRVKYRASVALSMIGTLTLPLICGECLLPKCCPWGKQGAFMLNQYQSGVEGWDGTSNDES
jgi:hypothetical protein